MNYDYTKKMEKECQIKNGDWTGYKSILKIFFREFKAPNDCSIDDYITLSISYKAFQNLITKEMLTDMQSSLNFSKCIDDLLKNINEYQKESNITESEDGNIQLNVDDVKYLCNNLQGVSTEQCILDNDSYSEYIHKKNIYKNFQQDTNYINLLVKLINCFESDLHRLSPGKIAFTDDYGQVIKRLDEIENIQKILRCLYEYHNLLVNLKSQNNAILSEASYKRIFNNYQKIKKIIYKRLDALNFIVQRHDQRYQRDIVEYPMQDYHLKEMVEMFNIDMLFLKDENVIIPEDKNIEHLHIYNSFANDDSLSVSLRWNFDYDLYSHLASLKKREDMKLKRNMK